MYRKLGLRVQSVLPDSLLPIARGINKAVNVALAKKPEFVIVGTGRSGTTFIADILRKSGHPCSHEAYFTTDGPKLRNPNRGFYVKGDASWLAAPYLPDPEMIMIHQVRHPYKVISSIYNTGFFDESRHRDRMPFVNFVKNHFRSTGNNLHDCLRFYIEWNLRCEDVTDKRFSVERVEIEMPKISTWLGVDITLNNNVSQSTNSRAPEVLMPIINPKHEIRKYPEYKELVRMAERYGYDL